MISNKLKDSYFNDKLIEESKKLAFNFFDVVKNSPLLQLEFKVFDNIENKHIENDIVATRYIDNNIKLFEVYTVQEIDIEREKLNQFVVENITPNNNEKVLLYNAIDNLIRESLNNPDKVNVDELHESFVYVLNHIKTPKKVLIESVDVKEIDDSVIEIAVDKFNEKYESLNEDDRNLLKTLIKSSDEEKASLLESYKSDNLQILENLNTENNKDSIVKAIHKIKEMVYNKDNVDDNIISLYELKKELL